VDVHFIVQVETSLEGVKIFLKVIKQAYLWSN